MQIDGIAISNSKVYVIEAKGWKAKDLIQDYYTREILEDEIRNAIDGLDFTAIMERQRKKLGISAQADIIGILVITGNQLFRNIMAAL
jgi:hypothetical protein